MHYCTNCVIIQIIYLHFQESGKLRSIEINYFEAIETLKKEGYQIENVVYHDVKKHITRSIYILKNKDFSPSDSDLLTNI